MKNQIIERLSAKCKAAILANSTLLDFSKNSYSKNNDDGVSAEIIFPIRAVFGVVMDNNSEDKVVLAIRGNDSVVGNVFSKPSSHAHYREECLVVGDALVIPKQTFNELRKEFSEIDTQLLRCTMLLTSSLYREVGCFRAHTSTQRFADRIMRLSELCHVPSALLSATPMGEWIGVKRSTVMRIASDLRESDILERHGQYIRVKNLRALKMIACGCSQTDGAEQEAQLFLEFPRA